MKNLEPNYARLQIALMAVLILSLIPYRTQADGTANLSPIATDIVMLNLLTGGFANYGSTGTDKSMCFEIKDPNETVYFGFSQIANSTGAFVNGDYNFQIVDAATGAVVQAPFTVTPTNANGNDYNDVIAGPDLGTGVGYDVSDPGFVFNPPGVGEYCIEFENQNIFMNFSFQNMGLTYWDVTVVDGAGAVAPGRLHSTCWGLRTPCSAVSNCTGGPWDQPLNGEIWVLTDDGFVHSIDFSNSGFQGLSFFLAFNDTGPGTTGNPVIDRKSIDGNVTGNASATDPLYPIYLDVPDPACYEPAEIGMFFGPMIIAPMCDYDNACLEFTVTQTGLIEIIIDLDGPGDGIFTPGTADTVIAIRIDEGEPFTQCVPWDLIDGLGNQVMPGDDVFFTVNYQQGEIHFMQYDVETVCNGFIPSTLVPPGANNLGTTYYDDACLDPNDNDPNLDGDLDPTTGPMPPLTEIDGCPAPCHTWKLGNSSGQSGGGYGEVNTINTWWFGNTQTITIQVPFLDENPPSFDCPPDVVLDCGMPTDTASTGSVINIMDDCSTTGFIVSFVDDAPFDACTGSGIVNRTFYVEDPDGNIDSCTQMITLVDMEAPVITCPPDLVLLCGDPVPIYTDEASFIAAGGTLSDNCAIDNFALTDSVAVPMPNSCIVEVLTLTYTATDECGLQSSCTMTISIENMTPVTFTSCPMDVTVDCGMATDTSALGVPTLSGIACGESSLMVMDEVIGGSCPDNMIIMRMFILDDGCFAPDTCFQTITIEDSTSPVFDMPIPVDTTVECAAEVPPAPTLNLTDNCGSMFMVMPVDVIMPGSCPNDFVVLRTWEMEDPCGNVATATQTITVSDTQAPIFDMPPPLDLFLECAADVPAPVDLSVTDNCDGTVLVSPVDDMLPGSCPNDFILLRTWTYTDACDNNLTYTQTITVIDVSIPVFDTPPPADLNLDCAADVPDPVDLSVTDNCDGTVLVSPVDVLIPGTCPNDFTLERTWAYTDECNNELTYTQTIIVSDTSIPMFDTPPPGDVEVECASEVPPAEDISVTDNCDGTLLISPVDVITNLDQCPNRFTIDRTWEYTDACGNILSYTQLIIVDDITPPELICQDLTIDFMGMTTVTIDPADFIVSVSDNCGPFDLFADPPIFDCADVILDSMGVVEIIAIDSCANVASCIANITFINFPSLEIFCPNDTTIFLGPGGCDAVVPYVVTADNPCGEDAVITQIDTSGYTSGDDFPIGITEQEYMATNEYGDTVSCSFTITVIENMDSIQSLVCNDMVNISVDQNCLVTIDADMILEGSNHGCYDDFIIEIFTIFGDTVANPITYDPDYSPTNNNYMVCVTEPETGIQCCGEITLEDKLLPAIECPCPPGAWMTDPACNRTCLNIDQILNGQIGAPDVDDNCSGVIPVFGGAELIEQADCGSYIIEQRWSLATEGYNGEAFPEINCTNEYYISPIDLTLVTSPGDVIIDCTDAGNSELTHPSNTGYPKIGGNILDGDNQNPFCNIIATYSDVEIPACNNSCPNVMKIARFWSLVDWCTGEIDEVYQLIKISDDEGPSIIMEDVFTSTDAWKCSADVWFPEPQLHDNCSSVLDWYIESTNSGATLVDVNGQQNSANPKQHALNVPKGTWEFVIASADCCGNIGSTTIEVTVADLTAPVAIAKEYLTISLTSAGLDPDGFSKLFKSSINEGSHENCSDVFIEIRRETDACNVNGNSTYSNKIPAVCDPWYASNDHDYGEFVMFCCEDLNEVDDEGMYGMVKVWMRVWDDANMDGEYGSYTYYDNPGNDHDYCEFDDNFNEVYSWVRVENNTDANLVCPPDITISCDWDYTDLSITGSSIGSTTCGTADVVYSDWVDIHCGEGTVLRDWSIPGYAYTCTQTITITPVVTPLEVVCPVDPATQTNEVIIDCDDYEIPEPWVSSAACTLTGISSDIDTFWFEAGSCYKVVKTWRVIDWCSGEEVFCDFTVSLIDTEAPMVTCQDTCIGVDDFWDADGDGNKCEFASNILLRNSAGDPGACGSEWIKWLIQIDYWGDGTVEYEGSSFVPHNAPNYVAPTQSGQNVNLALNKDLASAEWARHIVKWKAFDGCGNVNQCTQIVEVGDKKAPTPYCIEISTALMDSEPPLVEIWAKDFNAYSSDNCTDSEQLIYTFDQTPPVFSKITQEHCFDENGEVPCSQYENGFPIQKWNPMSNSSGTKYIGVEYCGVNEVRVSVWDNKENTDYCRVSLIVHGNACDSIDLPVGNILGAVRTEYNESVSEVAVEIMTNNPLYPKDMMTSTNGSYAFYDNIMYTDYNLIADKDDNYLNGVSTLDLVFIQRHILGLKLFDSHYKSIAADANNDYNVSAVDVVELRKLILGITEELLLNKSWRIVDPEYTEEVNAPFPFSETILIDYLEQEEIYKDFVAVKIGDVNGSATANLNTLILETRSKDNLEFIQDNTEHGRINVRAGKNFAAVYGFQFSAELNGVLSNIVSDHLQLNESNYKVTDDEITISYSSPTAINLEEGTLLFSLEGINRLELLEGTMKNEAYKSDEFIIEGIEFRDQNNAAIETRLLQNEPNPFTDETIIRFTQAKDQTAQIHIFDVAGRKVKTIQGEFNKGLNTIRLNKSDLGQAGIYHLRYSNGSYTQTSKIILLD